ncbi:MAG: hypothetical protein CMJ20_13620 [Phycisphaeraceae bacterium]|nr:hypothetical protein [Phycisphaeraceae bacterium]
MSQPLQLVVFSDDWGRHPSSCQHLIRLLSAQHSVLWVNTIGTRRPTLSFDDLGKAVVKLGQWLKPSSGSGQLSAKVRVITPPMYPGFRSRWQRWINTRLISQRVNQELDANIDRGKRVAIATLPIAADLVDQINVDYWVYYCVDDFSTWPGLDGSVMKQLDQKLAGQVDRVICVSQVLQGRMAQFGYESQVLTHGVDPTYWQGRQSTNLPAWWSGLEGPVLLFWGLVDRRLDTVICKALAEQCGTLVLVGPRQSPDPRLVAHRRICMPGPVGYETLPALAQAADILVMPYADLPVTRSIQPLKFKEYLATGKPVIARRLPATVPWADAADLVDNAGQCVQLIKDRIGHGTPFGQQQARRRLGGESWMSKAEQFEKIILDSVYP